MPLCVFWVSDHVTPACRVKSQLWVLTVISWVCSHHRQGSGCMYRERELIGNLRTFPLAVPLFWPFCCCCCWMHVWVFCFPICIFTIAGGAIRGCQILWNWSYRWSWAIYVWFGCCEFFFPAVPGRAGCALDHWSISPVPWSLLATCQ